MTHDVKSDTYVLIMVENRPWGESPDQMLQLQAKINTYLTFALDGEMTRKFPESRGKRLRLQLDCVNEPDAAGWRFIELVREKLRNDDIEFVVNLL